MLGRSSRPPNPRSFSPIRSTSAPSCSSARSCTDMGSEGMAMGEGAVAVGGYQGERSIHTRALRALVGALGDAPFAGAVNLDIDVTVSGTTAQQLFDAVDGGGRQACYMASSYLTARVPSLAVLDLPFSVA